MIEITKISSKGQVVIPAKIREELQLKEGSVVAISKSNNIVMLKKLSVEEALKEFERLTEEGEKYARARGIKSEEDIDKIIHERREKRRAQRSS